MQMSIAAGVIPGLDLFPISVCTSPRKRPNYVIAGIKTSFNSTITSLSTTSGIYIYIFWKDKQSFSWDLSPPPTANDMFQFPRSQDLFLWTIPQRNVPLGIFSWDLFLSLALRRHLISRNRLMSTTDLSSPSSLIQFGGGVSMEIISPLLELNKVANLLVVGHWRGIFSLISVNRSFFRNVI